MTPTGIEPAAFRFLAQHLKHCATAVPVLQETAQIRLSCQARTNVSGRSFSLYSKGAIDVRNAFKAYFNGLTAAILS